METQSCANGIITNIRMNQSQLISWPLTHWSHSSSLKLWKSSILFLTFPLRPKRSYRPRPSAALTSVISDNDSRPGENESGGTRRPSRVSSATPVSPSLVLGAWGWDGDEESTGNSQSQAWGLGTVTISHMPRITLTETLEGEREESEEEEEEEAQGKDYAGSKIAG